jgi:hypothetical protein
MTAATIDPGDASEAELEALLLVSQATSLDRDVDIAEVFTFGAVWYRDAGTWEGRAEIAEGLNRWSSIQFISELRDFTRIGERLVFNWNVNLRTLQAGGFSVKGQGVEAAFDGGLIRLLEVTSVAVPYCIGDTTSGCKDYETGGVLPLDPAPLPLCAQGVVGPCRNR